MATRNDHTDLGWYWTAGTRTSQSVVEREPDPKPLLYDATGQPLMEERPPVGFRPEKRDGEGS